MDRLANRAVNLMGHEKTDIISSVSFVKNPRCDQRNGISKKKVGILIGGDSRIILGRFLGFLNDGSNITGLKTS